MAKNKGKNDGMYDANDLPSKIGAKIREIREAKGMTQEAFYGFVYPGNNNQDSSKKQGAYKWEKGTISLATLCDIAKAVGIKLDEFLKVDTPNTNEEGSLCDWEESRRTRAPWRTLPEWCEILFADMPESLGNWEIGVDWNITEREERDCYRKWKDINITLSIPMDIVHDPNTGYPIGFEDSPVLGQWLQTVETIKGIKSLRFMEGKKKRELAINAIDELEKRLDDDIPF